MIDNPNFFTRPKQNQITDAVAVKAIHPAPSDFFHARESDNAKGAVASLSGKWDNHLAMPSHSPNRGKIPQANRDASGFGTADP